MQGTNKEKRVEPTMQGVGHADWSDCMEREAIGPTIQP